MPKTHYLGRTKDGRAVGRASKSDYGYTHAAAVTLEGRLLTNFSTSAQGALNLISGAIKRGWDHEIVEVKIVPSGEYRKAMGK